MRILIAEDDVVSNRMLESVLNKWGYGVMATRDGVEAWRKRYGVISRRRSCCLT